MNQPTAIPEPASARANPGSPENANTDPAGTAVSRLTSGQQAGAGTLRPPASPWRRFMSVVYEGIILFGVVFFFGYGFSALSQYQGGPGLHRTIFQLYMFGVLGIYFAWFWSRGRWSLPMKTIGVRLVRDDGTQGAVSPLRAFWRYTIASLMFWGTLGLIWTSSPWWLPLFFMPFGWSVFDRKRRTLYDVLSGTLLIDAPQMPIRKK